MWILLLEALAAGAILIGIVWWTMFSGRKGGERIDEPNSADEAAPGQSTERPQEPPPPR
jgi:hypothetical protein